MTGTNGKIRNVTDDNFNDAIADGVSVVDFWASRERMY